MVKNKFKPALIGAIAIALFSTFSLASCTSAEKLPETKKSPTTASNVSAKESLEYLKEIAEASNERQETDGITETFSVNSQGTVFEGHGDITWTTVYDPSTKAHTSRYPSNPSYREAGPGPQAVGLALAAVTEYKATDTAPTEEDGVFTFEGPYQVIIIYTKAGLVTSVLIQDTLDDPSFTNFYEVNFYNITNPIADQILKTKE